MKVVLFGGAGGVGASVAFNLLLTNTPQDVVVVDHAAHHGHQPSAEEYVRTWYVRHVALDSGRAST